MNCAFASAAPGGALTAGRFQGSSVDPPRCCFFSEFKLNSHVSWLWGQTVSTSWAAESKHRLLSLFIKDSQLNELFFLFLFFLLILFYWITQELSQLERLFKLELDFWQLQYFFVNRSWQVRNEEFAILRCRGTRVERADKGASEWERPTFIPYSGWEMGSMERGRRRGFLPLEETGTGARWNAAVS